MALDLFSQIALLLPEGACGLVRLLVGLMWKKQVYSKLVLQPIKNISIDDLYSSCP